MTETWIAEFFKFVWPLLVLPIGWLFKEVNLLKKTYYETRIHASDTYVDKQDYRNDIHSLHVKLDAYAIRNDANYAKILDKLERKEDKK